tara:strand:+ start:440 stop:1477 length:1038 start_codon:yes stop_codon:yes gene_type:complete
MKVPLDYNNSYKVWDLKEYMEDIIDEVMQSASGEEKLAADNAIDLDTNCFHGISQIGNDKKIGFIDGGNATLLTSPHVHVEFIRVFYVVYQNGKRIVSEKKEFFSVIKSKQQGESIVFTAKSFGGNYKIEDLEFDSFDKRLSFGNERVSIANIAGIIRKLAELKIMEEMIDDMDGGFIVRDGDLEVKLPYEGEIFQRIIKKCEKNTVGLGGLSKTSSLLTNKGNTLVSSVMKIAPASSWYYYPLIEKLGSKISVVKLHEKSKFCFRFDYFGDGFEDALSLLQNQSKDISVLGYPYGLYEVDRFGRVSNEDKAYLTSKFLFSIKDQKNLEVLQNSVNFHQILDNLS